MILNSTPILATSAKVFARSVLFSLGVDHTLIEFVANTAIQSRHCVVGLLYVGLRIPRSAARKADPTAFVRISQ